MVDVNKPDAGVLKAHAPEIALTQRVADALIIAGSHIALLKLLDDQPLRNVDAAAMALAVASFLLIGESSGLYRAWRGARTGSEITQVLVTWVFTLPVLLFIAFATKTTADFSRLVTSTWFVATPIALATFRFAVRMILQEARRRGYNTRRVAIAGSTAVGEKVAQTLQQNPTLGLQVKGVYDDRAGRRHEISTDVAPFVGSLSDLCEHARQGMVDIIYVALPLKAERRITELLSKLADTTVTVYVVPEFHAYDLLHARWSTLGDIQVVSIFDSPFNGLGGTLKRIEDVVLGTAILGLIAIPMLVIAALVKLDSPGPVFFRQRRYGLNGKPINVLKYRTMKVAENGPVVTQASKDDPRITKLGRVLRKTSLDELPQFLNVVAGDMSIVGPRPHAVVHNELYRARIHGYMLRHKVRPGITGWAQVNGWRGETETLDKMERRIEHDLFYIENWRLLWDLKIIWLTVFGARTRANAY